MMLCSEQNLANSLRNCGPPSDRIEIGQPYWLNRLFKNDVSAEVVSEDICLVHKKPENLSTMATQGLAENEK